MGFPVRKEENQGRVTHSKSSEKSISRKREQSIASNAVAVSYKDEEKRLFIRLDNVKIDTELDKSYLYRGRDERLIGSASKECRTRK